MISVRDQNLRFPLLIMIYCDLLAPRLLNHPFQVLLRRIFGRSVGRSVARSLARPLPSYALIKTYVGLTRRP